ncbi:hypothetical protein [Chryseobacterium sp. Marseille-Q3244]|uniref:hypothetical protein n=1 Tax=Chryseobacterium sp. Marseille-Q3244 TaxID=2758092 RepID=UPI002024BC8C|nr:hypothetical protein [Chryseobacterium sp. Marseille-Q3244]
MGRLENLLLKMITDYFPARMIRIFANKYLLYLPKEEELKQIIDQDRIRFELNQKNKNP